MICYLKMDKYYEHVSDLLLFQLYKISSYTKKTWFFFYPLEHSNN